VLENDTWVGHRQLGSQVRATLGKQENGGGGGILPIGRDVRDQKQDPIDRSSHKGNGQEESPTNILEKEKNSWEENKEKPVEELPFFFGPHN